MKMIDVTIGALIAALNVGITASLALLMGDTVNGLEDISRLQWIILVVGTVGAFAKDFQAIWTRERIQRWREGANRTMRSPLAIGLIALLMLGGCAQVQVRDAIGAAYFSIDVAADTIHEGCYGLGGEVTADRTCRPGAQLDTETAAKLADLLRQADRFVDDAALIERGAQGQICEAVEECLLTARRILSNVDNVLADRGL